jgi:hypothetical protein
VQQINTPIGLTNQNDPVIIARRLLNEGNARPETLPLAWTAEMSA